MPWPLGWFIPMGGPLIFDAFMPVPMFPGRVGGPRGPGWFMNWLLYAWFGPIWKEELIWKTKWVQSAISELTVNVANFACGKSTLKITKDKNLLTNKKCSNL